MQQIQLAERVRHEVEHGSVILRMNEANWGWHSAAGKIRRQRRADFLSGPAPQLGAGAAVLEVGCGTGTFTGALAEKFGGLVSIDVSEDLLQRAREKFPLLGFEQRDIHQTGYPSASFDYVAGCSVLHHLDCGLALAEIRRILKPGGRLRFCEPNMLNPQIFLQKNWPWLKRRMGDSPDETAFTPGSMRAALQQAGFVGITVEPFEFLHPYVPSWLIGPVTGLERWLQATPVRQIAGSLRIEAFKPA